MLDKIDLTKIEALNRNSIRTSLSMEYIKEERASFVLGNLAFSLFSYSFFSRRMHLVGYWFTRLVIKRVTSFSPPDDKHTAALRAEDTSTFDRIAGTSEDHGAKRLPGPTMSVERLQKFAVVGQSSGDPASHSS